MMRAVRRWSLHHPTAALLVGAAALVEGAAAVDELALRQRTFAEARAYADARRKPLLNVGCLMPIKQWWHPCGDVCVDLDGRKAAGCRAPRFEAASVLALPFPDHLFGAATCFHVLEHMRSIDDAAKAVAELERVSDRVYVLVPGRHLRAIFHEDHYLWLDPVDGGYLVTDRQTGEQRRLRVRDPQPGVVGAAA